ncbi:MAG: toxin-activating lysine-acyltransferase [Paracoccaceae bacterium]
MARTEEGKAATLAERIEYPDPELLRIYGDFAFLVMRSQRQEAMPMADFRAAVEPPVTLGQYRIFRFDEVPRGLITWAMLNREAERKYVTGGTLQLRDWRCGNRLWLIDLIAPYRGLTARMVRWIMQPGNFAKREFFFRRVGGDRQTRRIVHIDFERAAGKALILREDAFA